MVSPTKTWGLVLSGGAAWGIANAGILEVLERENLKPDYIAGSSMGAIIGALAASGHDAKTLKKLCKNLSLTNVFKMEKRPWKGGLHGGILRQALEDHLEPLLGNRTIGDCEIPFICVAGRVVKAVRWEKIIKEGFTGHFTECIEPYVFPPRTRLLDAVMASSALPVLFHPVKIGKDSFIDLVSFGAIPSRQLQKAHHPDILIATDTNPDYKEVSKFLPRGWRQYIKDGFASIEESKALCDLVIRPALKGNPYRFDKAMGFYEAGRKAGEKVVEDIKTLISTKAITAR